MTRVVIVDDDEAIRETLRFAFEDVGYEVSEAADGLAALALLRALPDHAVVLLDLMMPRLDGEGVLNVVATDHALRTRFAYIVVTANTRTLTLAFVNLLRRLSIPILNKPFDLDLLLDMVNQAAERLSATKGT